MEESNETSKKRKLDDVDAEKDDPTVLKKDQKEEEQDEEIKENDGNSNEEPTKREENDNNNNTTNQDISTTKANLDVTKDNENEETKTMDNTSNDDDPKDDETKENETKRETEKPTTTVSTGNANNVNTHSSKDKVKSDKNPYETLKWIVVKNDGRPESLIKLVALKSLFAKQLPKMPRAYIARLVFDRRHTAIAILNEDPKVKDTDEEVIGSICYRAFPEMRFAEIAFCAVNASHQVKGYGTKLMNLLKQQGARTGIEYFITYADNYAIGYFKKQGFTKTISMPKGRYQGLIKDYDGGTMMECYVHPSIDFTRIPEMLAAQRAFLLDRIRLKANSHRVYEPLPNNFSPNLEGVSRANEAAARAMAIPGMLDAGWTMTDLLAATGQGKDVDRAKNALKSELLGIVRKVEEQQFAWPFREPVDTSEVHDYLEVIKEPIDLSTIEKRIRKGDHYKSKQMLYADLILMVNNCKLYNEETSTYVQCANTLETYLGNLFRA